MLYSSHSLLTSGRLPSEISFPLSLSDYIICTIPYQLENFPTVFFYLLLAVNSFSESSFLLLWDRFHVVFPESMHLSLSVLLLWGRFLLLFSWKYFLILFHFLLQTTVDFHLYPVIDLLSYNIICGYGSYHIFELVDIGKAMYFLLSS